MTRIYILGFMLLFVSTSFAQGQIKNYTISGYVKEKGSGELLIGVNIYIKGTQTGTVTNNYGFYSLSIPAQDLHLIFSYVGYNPLIKHFRLNNLGASLGELNPKEIKLAVGRFY